MRSEDQIKRKINELKNSIPKYIDNYNPDEVRYRINTNEKIELLEWVLNAPTESYHE